MHIEARLFEFVAAFFVVTAVLYGVLTSMFATGGVEWAGTTALALTGGMALIVATFFRFVARRLDSRPEDYEGAEISDGAGELDSSVRIAGGRSWSRCPARWQRSASRCGSRG